MNTFVATGRDGSEAGAVRVQCEAVDCGALLEVTKSGGAARLLEVWLHMPFSNSNGASELSKSRAQLHSTANQATPTVACSIRSEWKWIYPGHGPMLGSSLNQYSAPAGQSVADNRAVGQRYPFVASGSDGRPGFVTLDGVRHRDLHIQEEEFGSGGKARRVRKIRNPSPYNLFMSEEVKRIKAEHPAVDHKQAFKMAARHWAKSPYDCRKISSLRSITNRDGSTAVPQSAPLALETIPNQMEPALGQDSINHPPMDSLMTAVQIKNEGLPPNLSSGVLDPNGVNNLTTEPGTSGVPPFLEAFMERTPSSTASAMLSDALPKPSLLEAHPSFKPSALMPVNPRLPSTTREESLPQLLQMPQTEAQNSVIASIGLDLSPSAFLASTHTAKLDEAQPIE
ncbi:hypothetical protein BSKO_03320 [Bryopsis sp. KO-2023]|nr:hypothetical protein BSKO_03320 [Bryopsis sp. KO-2023]